MWLQPSRIARPAAFALLASLTAFAGAPLPAGTVVLQNDSVVDFGSANIQAGFAADEWGGAWLTSSCTGEVTALRYLWLSLPPNGGQTLGQAVRISAGGTFPAPGNPMRELLGPVFTEGAFNDVALEPPLPIHQGQVVVVLYQFFEGPPINGPSLVTDVNGCQAGKNSIFAIPPSAWFSACALGVTGDFAIRAVVDCQPNAIFRDGFGTGNTVIWSLTVL